MIQAIGRHSGRPAALCVCDQCGTEIEVACDYEMIASGKWLPNEGQVLKKITGSGWANVKGRLRCSACETARKSASKTPKEKPAVTNVEPIRQATREQKRQISDMLDSVYDIKAGRYTGTETDITVADAVGGGCMFGWVAEIRELMYGPDGGNEEHDALARDIAQWRANADKLAADMHGNLREFNDARAKVAALETRLVAVVKAAGPKAARA